MSNGRFTGCHTALDHFIKREDRHKEIKNAQQERALCAAAEVLVFHV